MNNVDKLINLFDKELRSSLQSNLILPSNDGMSYLLFGKFKLSKQRELYLVQDLAYNDTIEFSSMRYATAWCTLRHNNRHSEARRLQSIDMKLASLGLDIEVHRNIIKAKPDSALLYKIKLREESYKKRQLLSEIDTIVEEIRTLQFANFESPKINKHITWKNNL